MFEFSLLFQGLVIGFAMSAPMGPVALLCIQRTVAGGKRHGFITGLGAASADVLFAVVAALGLTVISNFIEAHRFWLQLAGSLFLCGMGVELLARPPAGARHPSDRLSHFSHFSSAFLITITNPITFFAFAAVFAALGLVEPDRHSESALLLTGVFSGALGWWTLLTFASGAFRARLAHPNFRWCHRAMGGIILVVGLAALVNSFWKH